MRAHGAGARSQRSSLRAARCALPCPRCPPFVKAKRCHAEEQRRGAKAARQDAPAKLRDGAADGRLRADAMPWLADTDVVAAHALARRSSTPCTTTELQALALLGLSELVPADVLTWDRLELATDAVHHEALPADAEPLGAFAATVGTVAGHPLLAAHADRRHAALRL